jgi:CO/xanthine dehydrogenase Mo-binding subunit
LPHARILNVDTLRAKSLPGVKAVITAHDASSRLVGASLKNMPVLAQDRVRFVGEEIAAVAAIDSDAAEEAIALVHAEYDELPAVFDPLEAMKAEAPLIHPDYASYEGPPTKAPQLRNVQTLVQQSKGDIEKGFAESDYIFENSYQMQMVHQGYIEPHACVVDVDGNGRVAVWSSNQGMFKLRNELAEFLGLRETDIIVHPASIGGSFGAKDNLSHVPVAYYLSSLTGRPLKFVNAFSEELLARSPRHPAFILELRMRNAPRDGDTKATGEFLEDPHCKEVLTRLAKISSWSKTRSRHSNGRLYGRGMALGDRHVGTGESSCDLILNTDGDLCLRSGIGDQGVGAYTMHRQVVSQIIGIEPERVHIEIGDTNSAPYDEGIKGARGMHVEGRAVAQAAEALVESLCAAAASHWRTDAANVSWSRSKAILNGSKATLSLSELARLSTNPIQSFGHYKGEKSAAYSFQALAADVAVDPETGQISVIRLYFVYDITTVINPLIHQGQREGAIVQGLGYALCAEMGIEDGRVMVSSLGEYKIFCVRDVPPLITSFVTSTVGPGPFSTKAVGEAGISIVAPAIANAVYDATGVRITQLPITPDKIVIKLASSGCRTGARLNMTRYHAETKTNPVKEAIRSLR